MARIGRIKTLRLNESLNDVFATRSHVRILRVLHAAASPLTGREVGRRAGVSHPTALSVLHSLTGQGLATVAYSSAGYSYSLNVEHVLWGSLHQLFQREDEIPGVLEDMLKAALRGIEDAEAAYLFGSAARGDMRPSSDIDVAIIARRRLPEELPQLRTLKSRFGNDVNVIRLKSRGGAPLRRSVLSDGRLLLSRKRHK